MNYVPGLKEFFENCVMEQDGGAIARKQDEGACVLPTFYPYKGFNYSGIRCRIYPMMNFKYPKTIAPTSANETYKTKTRCETRDQTAAMAGSVVVGPAIRKASAAAGLMP